MGINVIIPLITENTTVSPDIFKKKFPRFNKIIKSASEQSQRIFMPELKQIINFENLINDFNVNEVIISYEKSKIPLKHFLQNFHLNKVILVCGPEGGFSVQEAILLAEKNYVLASLGKNILRTETAVVTALGNIIYEKAI